MNMLKLEELLTSAVLVYDSTNQKPQVVNGSFPNVSGCQNKDSPVEVLVPKSKHFILLYKKAYKQPNFTQVIYEWALSSEKNVMKYI